MGREGTGRYGKGEEEKERDERREGKKREREGTEIKGKKLEENGGTRKRREWKRKEEEKTTDKTDCKEKRMRLREREEKALSYTTLYEFPLPVPPKIGRPPLSMRVAEGESASFDCRVQGTPHPVTIIAWNFDEKPLDVSYKSISNRS